MRQKRVTQEPFRSLIPREWKRAKRLLPQLKRMPKVYWQSSSELAWGNGRSYRSGVQGRCFRRANVIYVHEGYLEHGLYKEFVDTLRHEIAHLLTPSYGQSSHGQDFMWWLRRLGGSRYATSFKELLKDE